MVPASSQSDIRTFYRCMQPQRKFTFKGLVHEHKIDELVRCRLGVHHVVLDSVLFFDRESQEERLFKILLRCPSLERLDIYRTFFTKSLVPLCRLEHLHRFSFCHSGLFQNSVHTLFPLLHAQKHIKQLSLSRVVLDRRLLESLHFSIEKLELKDCYIGDKQVFATILSLSHLKQLNLQQCRIAPDLDYEGFKQLLCELPYFQVLIE